MDAINLPGFNSLRPGANNKEGGLEKAVQEYSEEVFEAAKAKAEQEGLALEAKTPSELFGMLF